MRLDFVKMHGAGNDFVFIDDLSEELELTGEQVRFLCDRHFGIGADGVILVRPPKRDGCVAYMHYINDDGSLAEMCGNGVRCFAKYLVDRGFVAASEGRLVADTLVGRRAIDFETDGDGRLIRATVDMGEPAFEPRLIPTTLEANGTVTRPASREGDAIEEPAVIEMPVAIPAAAGMSASGGAADAGGVSAIGSTAATGGAASSGGVPTLPPFDDLRFTCVNMGNPHAVAFLEGGDETIRGFNWWESGRALEQHPVFPEYANIELARVIEPGSLGQLEQFRPDQSGQRGQPQPGQPQPDQPVGESANAGESASENTNENTSMSANKNTDASEPTDALIEMRVWERGVGETLACGTGACAVAVAAAVTGRAARRAVVRLLGGDLRIEWREDNHVMMTGPATTVYEGTIEL